MSDPGDIDLDKHSDQPASDARSLGAWAAGVLALLVAGGAVFYYTQQATEPDPEPQTTAEAPAQIEEPPPAAPVSQEPPPPPLPPLSTSDMLARELIGAISLRPELATWLLTSDVIQAITVMVDEVARGQVPARRLGIVAPIRPFAASGDVEQATIDPASYSRYDAFADLVASIDAAGAARAYIRLRPLFDDAYGSLGYQDSEFDDALDGAIAQILDPPVIDGDVRLVPKGALFAYADDRLESTSHVQRQLLRMGPRNIRLLQAKAREFAAAVRAPE